MLGIPKLGAFEVAIAAAAGAAGAAPGVDCPKGSAVGEAPQKETVDLPR